MVERLSAFILKALVEVKKRDETRVAKVEMDDKDRHVLAAALSANADLLLTRNVRHFPREWLANRGIELVNAGTLLMRLASDYPGILREAHRLGVNSRKQTEEQVFTILVDQIGAEAMAVVRAAVTAGPQSESDSAN